MAEEEESILDTIRDLKRREPFLPFLVVMTSGDRYLIDDPDAMAFGVSQIHYYPRTDAGIHMRLNLIATVEEFGEKQHV